MTLGFGFGFKLTGRLSGLGGAVSWLMNALNIATTGTPTVTQPSPQWLPDYTGTLVDMGGAVGTDGNASGGIEGARLTDGVVYGTDLLGDPIDPAILKGTVSEPSATNLALNSANVSGYTPFQVTYGAGGLGPRGVAGGKITEVATTNFHSYYIEGTKPASAITYTHSFFCKSSGRNITSNIFSGGGIGCYAIVNPTTGEVVVDSTLAGVGWTTGSCRTEMINGFCFVEHTCTSDTTTALRTAYELAVGSSRSYAGDVNEYVEIFDAQVEAGTQATSRILTTFATVTRTTTGLSRLTADMGLTGQDTVKLSVIPKELGRLQGLLSDGTNELTQNADNTLSFTDGTATITTTSTVTADTLYTVTVDTLAGTIAINDAVEDTDATIAVTWDTTLRIGDKGAGTNVFNGNVTEIEVS